MVRDGQHEANQANGGKGSRKAASVAFQKLMVATPGSTESGDGFTVREIAGRFLAFARS